MQERYEIGNAQTIGNCEIQSNYFSVQVTDLVFAVLADGNADHINGRNAAILAVETSIREFTAKPAGISMEDFFESLPMQINQKINECIYLGKKPNVSISIACYKEDTLFYFTVGDIQICLADRNELKFLNGRTGMYKIKSTDTLVILSRGVQEALNEVELLAYLSKSTDPYEKAQQIIEEVNRKSIKSAKNATIILMERNV